MKKLVISACAILLAVFCFVQISVTVDAEVVANGSCGDDLSWTLDDAGKLTISGTGEMTRWNGTSTRSPWDSQKDNIKTVVVNEGVTGIGGYAFHGCQNLTTVTVADTVSNIGSFAFYQCENLTDVYFLGTEARWNVIEKGTENTTLSKTNVHFLLAKGTCGDNVRWQLDEEGVLTIFGDGEMYDYAATNLPDYGKYTAISAVVIKHGVTGIGDYAFFGGASANPEDNNIEYDGFYGCGSMTAVTIPESVTRIGSHAFDSCHVLEQVNYAGRKTLWEQIHVAAGNEPLTKNTISFVKKEAEIIKQPASTTVADGKPATATVTAIGEGLTYQWHYAEKNMTGFRKSSCVSSTYMVTMNAANDGLRAYCVITDEYGNSEITDVVTFSMAEKPAIIKQPVSTTVADGKVATATVTATGEGLKYQWYYAEKTMNGFQKSSCVSSTYTVTMKAANDGLRIYCVITDQYGQAVSSSTATLSMLPKPTITKQPVSTTVADGKVATATVTATGEGLTYQWYYAEKTMTGFQKSSCVSSTYTVTMKAANDGLRAYCVITNQYGQSVTTNTVTFNMATKPAITKQPASVTVANGKPATATVTATGEGLTYQWYYAEKNMNGFQKSSCVSSTYTVTMKAANDGLRAYCVITNQYGQSVTTNTVTFSMRAELYIIKQPASVNAVNGTPIKLSITVNGDGLKYQWYYAEKGMSGFKKSSCVSSTYTVTMKAANDGLRAYCVITDQYGQAVTTNTATLRMCSDLVITKQPTGAAVENGKVAMTIVTATGDGLTYQWYYSEKSMTSFKKSSCIGNIYTVTMSSANHGLRVYCVITDKYGQTVTTNTVTFSMISALTITKQPAGMAAANGKPATATVTATGEGLKYQWYYAEKGMTSFKKSSCTASTYAVTMSAANNGIRVYCVITDRYGQTATTSTVTLSMLSKPAITKQPVSMTVANGKMATVTVTATGEGLKYQWYYAEKSMSGFKKSSCVSSSYTLTMSTANNGLRAYCVITDKYGQTVTTNTVTLTMASTLTLTKQLTSVSAAMGQTATLKFGVSGEGVSYQWYYKDKGASTFTYAASATGNTYTVAMSKATNGRQVYCIAMDQYGQVLKSSTVTLTMK